MSNNISNTEIAAAVDPYATELFVPLIGLVEMEG